MRFIAKPAKRRPSNVSDTHPLVEASTCLVGLTAIIREIANRHSFFMVEIALHFVSERTAGTFLSRLLPDDLITVAPE